MWRAAGPYPFHCDQSATGNVQDHRLRIFARIGITLECPKADCRSLAGSWGHKVLNASAPTGICAKLGRAGIPMLATVSFLPLPLPLPLPPDTDTGGIVLGHPLNLLAERRQVATKVT